MRSIVIGRESESEVKNTAPLNHSNRMLSSSDRDNDWTILSWNLVQKEVTKKKKRAWNTVEFETWESNFHRENLFVQSFFTLHSYMRCSPSAWFPFRMLMVVSYEDVNCNRGRATKKIKHLKFMEWRMNLTFLMGADGRGFLWVINEFLGGLPKKSTLKSIKSGY